MRRSLFESAFIKGGRLKVNDKINVAFRQSDEKWSQDDFKYHSHDTFEIYYFHSGDCKYLIGDRIYELQPGDIIIMNGLTLHRANPLPTAPYERSVIEFSREWIRPILSSLNVPELLVPFYKLRNFLFRDIDKVVLVEIMELMKEINLLVLQTKHLSDSNEEQFLNTRLIEGRASTLLTQLLFKIYELSRERLAQLPPKESEKNTHAERVVTWIQQYFNNNISLSTIADSLNISKYHMCRIFKEVTGFTVMQYLMSCRINRAKYLLEMVPDKTILEVALESGFDNSSHFSRFFRQQVKMTPTEYRKRKNSAILDKSMEK